ncbi:hypothetical protein [Hymenobacter terricola]|uniref:hypothetical protein n=1 Tax=Hymenobacter terricola TaxID=2819236 RepID=UPI001B309E55|nr:hypothetical protein [Hymenobacter terricola]
MKIIQPGRAQEGWAKEYKCTGKGNKDGGCGAALLVEYKDLRHTKNTDYLGDSDYFVTFRCCSCGVLTDIPERDIPGSARSLPFGPADGSKWSDELPPLPVAPDPRRVGM